MKITRIETIPVQVPIKPQFAILSGRGGSHLRSPFLIVKIHTDESIVGLGEVSCTPRWSGEDNVTAAHFINRYFAPLLEGEDPLEIDALTLKIGAAIAGNPFTKASIEMALWDIKGKAEGVPVYQLMGGAVRDFIPTKWSISGVEPVKAAEIAAWALNQGFACMKVKVGIDPDSDVARVRAVREAVGPHVKLGVDANGGWDVETAIRTTERLMEFGIYFVEQPVPQQNARNLAKVKRAVSIPVIADESVYSADDAENLARDQACDVFSVYVGKAGGISAAAKIAQIGERNGIGCTVGSNLEMGIATAAMLHLAFATPGIMAEAFPCDIIGPLFYEADILSEPLNLTPGAARPFEKPGLGVELDDALVQRFTTDA